MKNVRNLQLMGEEHNMVMTYKVEAVRQRMITQRAKLWFEQAERKVNINRASPDTLGYKFNEFNQDIRQASEKVEIGRNNPEG